MFATHTESIPMKPTINDEFELNLFIILEEIQIRFNWIASLPRSSRVSERDTMQTGDHLVRRISRLEIELNQVAT